METSSGTPELKVISTPTYGGHYVKYVVAGTDFEVTARYKPPLRPIGRGAYGIVWLESLPLSLKLFYSILFST